MIIHENRNIWIYHQSGNPICITTNGFIKKTGECVMGKGIAWQAKQRYPKLPFQLGEKIKCWHNHVYYFEQYNLFSFPVKHNWWEKADKSLIISSLVELSELLNELCFDEVYMTKPGCYNGKLDWETEVRPIMEAHNDDRIIVCDIR